MSDLNAKIEVVIQGVDEWLKRELPGWATRARFHARRVDGEHVLVLTARDIREDVGYAVFDMELSHLYYVETLKRRRGVSEQLWQKVKASAVHRDITATADTEDGKRRLQTWGFVELDGMWTWGPGRYAGDWCERRDLGRPPWKHGDR